MPVKFATAEEEYIKNKDLKKEDIEVLQKWLTTQPHLPKISEFQIILFHHSCYYDMENTKLCMESYFTRRKNSPNIFTDRNPSSEALQLALKTFTIYPMPKRTPKGYSVVYKTIVDSDYRNYNCVSHIKLFDMVCSLLLNQEGTSEGNVIVIDMKNMCLGHFWKINVLVCKNYSQFLQESLPFRLKEIHIINGGNLLDKLMSFLKMIMSKVVFEMIHHHNSIETLYDFVPQDCLPADIGGYCDTTEKALRINVENLEDNKDFFLEDEVFVADDSKRVKSSSWMSFWK